LFFSRSISFVLLIGTALLLAPRVSAQGGGSIQSVLDPEELPDKPQPQVEAIPTGHLDDQQLDGQSGGIAAGKQSENIQQSAPGISVASISGTVTDTNGGVIGGATIELEGLNPGDRRTAVSSATGAFQFDNINPGVPYQIAIAAQGLQGWKSPPLVLAPGQFLFLTDIKLKVPNSEVSVTVYASQVQIATEQVVVAEKQRVLGIFPNFYVTYDPHPVPLTTKLKYRLAFKASTDPVTFVGIAFMAAVYQAGDVPDYQQGWDGYAQRVGAGIADTATDIFFGGAILPSLLHQDPRYFYQGTGTTKSRMLHAISYPYICKGDNGKTQPNYSSLGGDLISGAISNIYYPETNRGVGLVFEGFFVTTAVRTVNSIIQEFLLRKLTPSARQKN
jgi:hypothetical protein